MNYEMRSEMKLPSPSVMDQTSFTSASDAVVKIYAFVA
jgi:hypothetical protein